MGGHGQNEPQSAIMKSGLKSNKQRKYEEKHIIMPFSCKKWTYMKFSEDYVDFVKNMLILITVALWEICCRMFSFLQISEVDGH